MTKLKFIFSILIILIFSSSYGQNKNARMFYWTLKPMKLNSLLDSVSNTDISFALSLRKLKQGYTGNCIKIRRASDNTEKDIGFDTTGLVDTAAINNFRGASNAYVSIWYDQSELGRDARQATIANQPQLLFEKHRKFPVIKFDGSNDFLAIDTSIQLLTNAGDEGTVFYVGDSKNKSQWSFGSYLNSNSTDRWSTHTSWNNNNVYFDPGVCCNTHRLFGNTARRDSFDQYSFIKNTDSVRVKQNGIFKLNKPHNRNRCSSTGGFGIGAGYSGSNSRGHAINSFIELIMYRKEIDGSDLTTIETNQAAYWDI